MSLKVPRKNIYKILDSASHMKSVLNAVNEGVITFDSELKISMINRFALNLWGYSRDQILGERLTKLIAKPYSSIIQKYSKNKTLSEKLNLLNENIEINGIKQNGEKFPISLNFVENKIEKEIYYTVAITDLTNDFRNKEIQNCMLKISNSVRISTNIKELYKDIFKNLNVLIPTPNFKISLVINKKSVEEYNYGSTKRVTYSKKNIKGNIIETIINDRKALIYGKEEIEYLKENKKLHKTIKTPNSYIGSPLFIANEIIGVISIQSFDKNINYDEEQLSILNFISDQIAMAIDKVKSVQEMHYLAYYDKMTNLPNRTLFNDRAKIAFKNATRNKEKYVVLFLDLDEFKIVNDTMGHNAGDQLLKTISKRIVKSVREGDTISHWGGDEFTILSKIKNINDNKLLCNRILKNIKEKIIINRRKINCTVSIGGAIYPNDGNNIDELVQKADMAMYVSKTQGKDKYTLYNDEINEKMLEKLNLEIEVRKKLHQINKK
tara:strand:+ start:3521 stop:5002 length:1482 start_codon:yes stop_codon:yes gene_type:complete